MNAIEREALIEQLKREADEGRARIAERVVRRESDPYSMQETLLADARITKDTTGDLHFGDPIGEPPISETDVPGVLALYDGPQPDAVPSNGDPLFQDAVDKFSAAVTRRIEEIDFELVKRDRKISELEGELRDTKAMLGDALKRVEQTDEKLKAVINDLNGERKDRIAMIRTYETQVAEMKGRVSAVLRDWT